MPPERQPIPPIIHGRSSSGRRYDNDESGSSLLLSGEEEVDGKSQWSPEYDESDVEEGEERGKRPRGGVWAGGHQPLEDEESWYGEYDDRLEEEGYYMSS